ncbi:MAG: transketolase C-terminal domain-containing protein [Ferruginibacter sp.]
MCFAVLVEVPGQLGAQHSTAFEALYANIPGLKVISVSNPYDGKGLLKAAIRDDDPVIFMECEVLYGEKGDVPEEEYILPIGKAFIKRAGKDVTIVSFNKMMKIALGAAEELAKEGIEAEVIDLATIRPLDWFTILESVKKNKSFSDCRRTMAVLLLYHQKYVTRYKAKDLIIWMRRSKE